MVVGCKEHGRTKLLVAQPRLDAFGYLAGWTLRGLTPLGATQQRDGSSINKYLLIERATFSSEVYVRGRGHHERVMPQPVDVLHACGSRRVTLSSIKAIC